MTIGGGSHGARANLSESTDGVTREEMVAMRGNRGATGERGGAEK